MLMRRVNPTTTKPRKKMCQFHTFTVRTSREAFGLPARRRSLEAATDDEFVTALENWFVSNCNGDWEHQFGVRIDTLDNPGWSVDINLEDTVICERTFDSISVDRDEQDWVDCRVETNVFKGVEVRETLGRFLRSLLRGAASVWNTTTRI